MAYEMLISRRFGVGVIPGFLQGSGAPFAR